MKIVALVLVSLAVMEVVAALIRSRKIWGGVPFKSNGCNVVPEGNWGECCIEHDKAYRSGGWFIARLKADIELSRCIARNKNLFAAGLYFVGVRGWGMWAFQWGKKRELIYE